MSEIIFPTSKLIFHKSESISQFPEKLKHISENIMRLAGIKVPESETIIQ